MTDTDKDERFARDQLLDHYRCDSTTVSLIADDPPDLVMAWPDGTTWGVEVTRAEPHVTNIGDDRLQSFTGFEASVRQFVDEIRRETDGQRQVSYALSIRPAGPLDFDFNNRSTNAESWKSWKKQTRKQVLTHIRSGSTDTLSFKFGQLRHTGMGNKLRFCPHSGSMFPEVELGSMIEMSLLSKSGDFGRWSRTIDQRWLFLISLNPMADDDEESVTVIRDMAAATGTAFDGVFWCPCRMDGQKHLPRVIPVPLTTP